MEQDGATLSAEAASDLMIVFLGCPTFELSVLLVREIGS